VRSDTARAVLELAQCLRDHCLQRLGQHRAHHFLFFGREHVDDPVYGLGGTRGVQRGEHQVPRLCCGHGQAYGFEVAHFAHQDRIRVFAQRRTQGGRERERHRPDLALVDQAFLRLVHEFDRVFDRQDVAVFGLIEVVHHGRERGRFAGTRGTGHEHQAARLERQIAKNLRGIELLEREDFARNGTKGRGRATVLVEGVHTKTRQPLDLEGKIDLQELLVGLALRIVHDVVDHGVHRLVVQRIDVEAPHVAIDTDHGRQACRQVQVGGFVLDGECKQLGDVHGSLSLVG
jgi:hypothetical protein